MTAAIDLFAGWGGMTEGARWAGADVLWAANHWPLAVETHALNHPATRHVCQDLRQADWSTLPPYRLLLAAPACQGHSPASQPRRRGYHDTLRATAFAVVDCADVTEPDAIVVENVPSFLRWRLYPEWRSMLEKIGYTVEERIVHASRLGVAQRRTRLFLLGTRGRAVRPLRESRSEPAFGPLLDDQADGWRLVTNAPPAMRQRIERSRARQGERFLTQSTTGHQGVPLHEPIRTITTAASHWALVEGDRYRYLTGRELARGMGFHDTFSWPEGCTIAQVTKGLGNAVPPPVAQAVVGAVLDAVA